MSVKLISYTVPELGLFEEGIEDMEELIAYTARVSNPSNQLNTETSENLINYLIEHQHWSPLEMVNVCLEINTTRDIARQILRHRSFVFQELSQRYSDPTKELGFITRECRLQDPKNRQSSTWCSDEELQKWWQSEQELVALNCEDIYNQAIRRGIAKEVARVVLPEGLTKSRMYMNGTLRSWIHYCQLRIGKETQVEHREIAEDCITVISEVFPAIERICDYV